MADVQSCHETTLCLSALLTPVMLANMMISWLFILVWGFCVMASRTGLNDDSWVEVWCPTWAFYICIFTLFVNAAMPLFVGASTSSACGGLIDAISDLRYEEAITEPRQGGGGGSRSTRRTTQCANPENLIRINGILQYASELNTSQGMGFTLRSKRISADLVISVLIKGTAVLIGAFFLMEVVLKRRLTSGEEYTDGAGLGNATSTDEVARVYWDLLKWGSLALALVVLLMAFAAVRECRRVQETGRPLYDRADVREIEKKAKMNLLGLEDRNPAVTAKNGVPGRLTPFNAGD